MARRTILALAAVLLIILGAAHVYLHPTLQTTAHEDDTIARLEKLHQTLSEKTSKQEKALASYKATTLAAQDAVKAQANPTTSRIEEAVAARLAAIQREADLHAEAHQEHHAEPYVLQKHNGHVPFVFVAGLEGTGHHWWKAFWEQCGSKARPSLLGPLAWQRAAAVFNAKMALDLPASKLMTEAARAETNTGGTVYALNTLGGRNDEAMRLLKASAPGQQLPWGEGEGMGSYPNWWGTPTPDHKALQMPDVTYLGEALRGVQGAQLRIVLLTREPQQIVRSVCDKRNFAKSVGGCAAEVQILSLGAGILAAQLDALPPPPSVICEHVRFGKLQAGDADTLERLSVLSGIDDAARVAKRVRAPPSPPGGAGPKTERAKRDREQLVGVLARAQEAAVSACARQALRRGA
jgi:hypothetical protein